ncbi:MAG: CRISPR-associated protein Cas5 [Lewinellaceae bacterium]|nr:CRISPR-associated protein Cas5 [Lewinellaceae bacterium]
MVNCVVELKAQTASFRDPEFQNYHRSLELPPPTTVIGMVGAALGLSPAMAQDFFDLNKLRIGVMGKSKGKAKDLWKYNNRTNKMWLHHPNFDGSIVHRDILMFNHFLFAFQSENPQAIDQLCEAFASPVFALTLGNSDSLAKVLCIERNLVGAQSSEVAYCLLKGDVIGEVLQRAETHLNFSIYQTSDPIAHQFPLRFSYDGDYGKRQVSKVGIYSLVGKPMKLNFSVEGLQFENHFIPLVEI